MRHYFKLTPVLYSLVVLLVLSSLPRVAAAQKCDDDLLITIQRDHCFGDCPVYSAKIYADGTVVYDGKEFVKTIGERRHKISKENIQALIKEFERVGYWSLKDEYRYDEQGRSITDQPTTITSICLNGKKKRVVNYYFAPRKLDELEERIDSLAGLYQFIGPL